MRPYKNLDRSLDAFASLNLDNLHFVICGKKDHRFYPLAEKKVREVSLQDKVVFLGYVSEDELPRHYTEAAAFMRPSLNKGFSLPPLEAMACDCPVFVSNVASLAQVFSKAAYDVDHYETNDISEKIEEMLNNQALRIELSQAG